MDVAATTATAAAAASATGDTTAIGRARLAENFDTFLSLLTTQLKNQDPLSPLDSNQFTQQIVQMTGVEQQLATNDLLKKLVSNTTSGIATAPCGNSAASRASNPASAPLVFPATAAAAVVPTDPAGGAEAGLSAGAFMRSEGSVAM